MLNNVSDPKYFIRDQGFNAFDGVAFHYTVYRFLSRFLGLDGTFGAQGDPPNVSWIDFWETILSTNDMINANDGISFDPRHMYGVTNQDVFRWPTIKNGIEKQLLGYFIVALLLPGIPTLVWGEEQVCAFQYSCALHESSGAWSCIHVTGVTISLPFRLLFRAGSEARVRVIMLK